MNTIVSTTSSVSGPLSKLLDRLAGVAAGIMRRRREARQYRLLAGLSDDLLWDIGLRRERGPTPYDGDRIVRI